MPIIVNVYTDNVVSLYPRKNISIYPFSLEVFFFSIYGFMRDFNDTSIEASCFEYSLETMGFIQNNATAHRTHHSCQHNTQSNAPSIHFVTRIIQQYNLNRLHNNIKLYEKQDNWPYTYLRIKFV